MELIIYLQILKIYFFIGLSYLLIESFILGCLGQNSDSINFFDIILWPVSIMNLFGLSIRILMNKLKKLNKTK